MRFPDLVSFGILLISLIPVAYLLTLAAASLRTRLTPPSGEPLCRTRFLTVIPAYNESRVIRDTIHQLRDADYPAASIHVVVVADHCSDGTAEQARQAGATVLERTDGQRGGKGAVLAWLSERIASLPAHDAVVVLDADTRADPRFFRIMDLRLGQEERAIQGQHVIGNPEQGLYPALSWALMKVDNRFHNLGRANLGCSAKNMGDSICFRADIFRQVHWDDSLTEDFCSRLRLLLDGIHIAYEPLAVGYGEAPRTWRTASVQRQRWLRGAQQAGRNFGPQLLLEAFRQRDPALLDAALQMLLPSYSSVTLLSVAALIVQWSVNRLISPMFSESLVAAWAATVAVLFVYPFIGLALERAPLKAHGALLMGPIFILWRSFLAVASHGRRQPGWISTPHG